ncbi:hypothetical protein [Methylocella tundrae]|uniref:hypothetical protein n=1 Tax=Methylocella tundrae TaxID=227605 RepID=UPI001068E1AD|nr:hypothetical protein [Methylocella tundrae]WPP04197.1 hypothetical protein SIN04_17350 [Methylocella tundrae]
MEIVNCKFSAYISGMFDYMTVFGDEYMCLRQIDFRKRELCLKLSYVFLAFGFFILFQKLWRQDRRRLRQAGVCLGGAWQISRSCGGDDRQPSPYLTFRQRHIRGCLDSTAHRASSLRSAMGCFTKGEKARALDG